MNYTELKVARIRRHIPGREAAVALHVTVDGYFKKEQGAARITLEDAVTLTRFYGLTMQEFVTIFFDGELPFSKDSVADYKGIKGTLYPLRAIREELGMTVADCAKIIGVVPNSYKRRESGQARFTLDEVAKLSRAMNMSYDVFNLVFFRSALPFRKSMIA